MIHHELLVRFMRTSFVSDRLFCGSHFTLLLKMETVLESDSEEQVRGGETREEEEEEEEEEEPKKLEGTLHVSAPQELLLKVDQADGLCPESYRINFPDESRLLAIGDNFQRQYSHLYPDRKPLLLCPVNECGVKKFVSMTLRPTPTVFPELLTWGGCASFVANFLSLDPLEPPEGLPRYLFSSSSVLQSQRATCFECATLLCSLLLGAHYDVYCVSGYAVKEMCLLDQSLQECPLLDTEVKSVISEQEPQENKYTVKPLRELKSNFVTQQEKKKQDAEAARFQKHKLQESEQRPADPLQGLRVHCWVLVLSGSRSVQENFFIDPLTGNSYTTDNDNFLGIESVWNNLNYYVNMQDCRNGCADMVYDLEDLKIWEPVLFGATYKKQLILDVLKKKESKLMSKITNDVEEEEQPRAFEMPRSWVSDIPISKQDLETCWPGTQKVTQYRKAKLEKFAPDLMSDGLITRLTTYKDLNCTDVVMVKEWYQHRNDHLEEREVNEVDSFITESFKRVRRFHLLFHRYTSKSTHTEREMEFSNVGVEDLVRRVESPGEMTEFFEGRKDFLCYRHAVFDTQLSKPDSNINLDDRPVQKVVERFHRNRSKPANEDVAERVFLLAQRRIELTYHLEDHRFIPSKRSFIKPRESTENKKAEDFTQDMVSSFQVDPSEEPLKTLALHEMLVALMKDEDKVLLQIRESKKEVRDIVACREQEEGDIQLHFSPWTTTGAARARSQRQEMERLDAEEQRWLQEKEKDILAPLLIRLDNTETLSAEDAKQLHQDCLAEFKQRLVEHADLIQERYEKLASHWFPRQKAKRHKEAAPQKYQTLDWKLKRDPRLAPHLLC
ncbi:dynein regulatory complex subunit 7-like isoform X3 [Cottoperca gobio]|uniref:Dynein regulatory complex subunit 7 n=1 Tax=Cottoperca gobio TaxID=56716 RepID=A0A6J2Q197_COTGO|nr:dynein regulatory complex subunit 7-like isoform X3 [Cottoperca gobio]